MGKKGNSCCRQAATNPLCKSRGNKLYPSEGREGKIRVKQGGSFSESKGIIKYKLRRTYSL